MAMTADILRPAPAILDDFHFDSLSLIEAEHKQGTSTGAITGELVNNPLNRKNKVKGKHSPKPATKEFQVNRRNSLRKKSYYTLSQQPKPRKKRYSVHGRGGYEGRFDNQREIDQVFNINPNEKNPLLTEYPSYMIEYFVKNLNLMKKDPIIDYQILKAKINQQRIGDIIEKERIKRPMSMPIPNKNVIVSEKSKLLQKQNRESAPANMRFNYVPVGMSMDEYLNTPLDLYKYRKGHKSHGSDSTAKTKNTALSSGRVTHGSSKSGLSSIDTTALLPKGSDGHHFLVPTNKKGAVEVKRRSVQFDNCVISEDKLEASYEKYGLSPKESKAKFKIKEGKGNFNSQRLSNKGIISIASGGEVYNNFKMDIFDHSFTSWNEAENYIFNYYPEYYENEYLMTNLIMEIYTRRIITGRIALKLGTDKAKRLSTSDTSSSGSNNNSSSNVDDIWLGLKDVISSIYGEEQGNVFKEQRYNK